MMTPAEAPAAKIKRMQQLREENAADRFPSFVLLLERQTERGIIPKEIPPA